MITPNSTFRDVVDAFISLINLLVPVLVALALVLFLWGGVRYIYKSGDAHGKGADKEVFLWGLIALFVLFSIWGLLRLLKESFLS